jgi:ankyrin repeat protein
LKDKYGVTALIEAIRFQNTDLAQLLIKAGASLDMRKSGYELTTPLMFTAITGNLQIA